MLKNSKKEDIEKILSNPNIAKLLGKDAEKFEAENTKLKKELIIANKKAAAATNCRLGQPLLFFLVPIKIKSTLYYKYRLFVVYKHILKFKTSVRN